MRGCFICAKHNGDVATPGGAIHQDDLLSVSHRAAPDGGSDTYLGYVIIETRRHALGVTDLTRAEAQAVGEWVSTMARALTAVVAAEHVYAFVLGDHVEHFHEHVVARFAGAPVEFWGIRVDEWSTAPRGDAQAVASLCDRLRQWLAITPR
jgi:histidine triad (HIT) family protein